MGNEVFNKMCNDELLVKKLADKFMDIVGKTLLFVTKF